MLPADVKQSMIALVRNMGYMQVQHRDDLETWTPTPEEAERIQVPTDVRVLVQHRTGSTTERPVKLIITLWPRDRTTLVSEFPS